MKLLNVSREGFFALGCAVLLGACAASTVRGTLLPTRYAEDRFILVPRTVDNEQASFIADTGGGLPITDVGANRLRLRQEVQSVEGATLTIASLPQWRADAAIPAPSFVSGFVVRPAAEVLDEDALDGVLGQARS